MKFETTVKQMKVYLREGIRTAWGGIEDGDVLEWHVETTTQVTGVTAEGTPEVKTNQIVVVKKREKK